MGEGELDGGNGRKARILCKKRYAGKRNLDKAFKTGRKGDQTVGGDGAQRLAMLPLIASDRQELIRLSGAQPAFRFAAAALGGHLERQVIFLARCVFHIEHQMGKAGFLDAGICKARPMAHIVQRVYRAFQLPCLVQCDAKGIVLVHGRDGAGNRFRRNLTALGSRGYGRRGRFRKRGNPPTVRCQVGIIDFLTVLRGHKKWAKGQYTGLATHPLGVHLHG